MDLFHPGKDNTNVVRNLKRSFVGLAPGPFFAGSFISELAVSHALESFTKRSFFFSRTSFLAINPSIYYIRKQIVLVRTLASLDFRHSSSSGDQTTVASAIAGGKSGLAAKDHPWVKSLHPVR